MMSASYVLSTTKVAELPQEEKPQVAFVGRSNAGKSSLINHLTQQKDLARVSTTPGRTATINIYDIARRFYFVDLPGYGFTKEKDKHVAFTALITSYLSEAPHLKLALVIIDAAIGPTDMDIAMFEFLRSLNLPFIVIVNKIDKLSKNHAAALMQKLTSQFDFVHFIPHSIKTSAHRGQILEAIEAVLRQA